MPSTARRRPPQRRQAAKARRRPRWVVRAILMAASLFVVFCAAAGATLWFAESRRSLPTAAEDSSNAEQFTGEERKALENLLKERQ